MIRLHASEVSAQGKWSEVVRFVNQLGAIVNEIAPEANFQTMSTNSGDTAVQQFVDSASVTDVDELMDKVESDSRHKEAISKCAGQNVFMAGSERTIIYETTQV